WYCDRMDPPAQSVAQVPAHHLIGPSDRLAVVLDKDVGQRPLGDVGVAVIWPPLQNRSLWKRVPSQNLLVLANVLNLPVRAQVDDLGTLANPVVQLADRVPNGDIGGEVTNGRLVPSGLANTLLAGHANGTAVHDDGAMQEDEDLQVLPRTAIGYCWGL